MFHSDFLAMTLGRLNNFKNRILSVFFCFEIFYALIVILNQTIIDRMGLETLHFHCEKASEKVGVKMQL